MAEEAGEMAEKIMVRKLKLRQKSFCLAVEAPGTMEICEAKLVYRNVICPTQYPLKLEVKCREEKKELTVSADISAMELAPGDWDVYLYQKNGQQVPVILDAGTRLRLILGSYEIKTGAGFILFPMGSSDHMLTFRYRAESEYDSPAVAAKEFLAFAIWKALKPYWEKRRIWLVYEKYARVFTFSSIVWKNCRRKRRNGFFILWIKNPFSGKKRKNIINKLFLL